MNTKEILKEMTIEEKAQMMSLYLGMDTFPVERLGVKSKTFADGPHGVREDNGKNATHFPNLCLVGSTWDRDVAYKMGEAIADDCKHLGIDLLLAPGVNIKRKMLCGRNYEYFSEDPYISGELGASYINGLQDNGVAACIKHYAVNNQEKYRLFINVELSERVLREIYIKAFEIIVKKSQPKALMTAYNKINAVWCSENRHLITEILRDEWGYDGLVMSDWGGTQDVARAIKAGLDLVTPIETDMVNIINEALKDERLTMDDIDRAVLSVLNYAVTETDKTVDYDRDKQHKIAQDIAKEGMVLLKNENKVLPLTSDKYKTIAIIGEYAKSPLVGGQGAAQVNNDAEYNDIPFDELKKRLPDVEFKYMEMIKRGETPHSMKWPYVGEYMEMIDSSDIAIFFGGAMDSDDTECMDRVSPYLNSYQDFFIDYALKSKTPVIVVLQSGGAMILGDWKERASAIMYCYLGGEGTGAALADLLCGIANPSGKLSETFPSVFRKDLEEGDNIRVEYSEGIKVGYRYYDEHPSEIAYPFGFGLSYTEFEYSNLQAKIEDENLFISFSVKNTGDVFGKEVAQVYVGNPTSVMTRPQKELKEFVKLSLEPGETRTADIKIPVSELSYYNETLREWVVEPGEYIVYIGASSRDIRLSKKLTYECEPPYSMTAVGETTVG